MVCKFLLFINYPGIYKSLLVVDYVSEVLGLMPRTINNLASDTFIRVQMDTDNSNHQTGERHNAN